MKTEIRNKWTPFKFTVALCLIILFSLGMMLIDYGASFKGTEVYGQSLLFEHVDARVMYHQGLLLVVSSFLIMTSMFYHDAVRRLCK